MQGFLRATQAFYLKGWPMAAVDRQCATGSTCREQEKSHRADPMASVLVGCQGFEPWTY